jgi:hypothetical protein
VEGGDGGEMPAARLAQRAPVEGDNHASVCALRAVFGRHQLDVAPESLQSGVGRETDTRASLVATRNFGELDEIHAGFTNPL